MNNQRAFIHGVAVAKSLVLQRDCGLRFSLDGVESMLRWQALGIVDASEHLGSLGFLHEDHLPVQDRLDHEVLKALSARILSRQLPLHPDLAEWLSLESISSNPPPVPKTKPDWYYFQIAGIVQEVARQTELKVGANPEPRDGRRNMTACDAVAAAMSDLGLKPASAEVVQDIFYKWHTVVP